MADQETNRAWRLYRVMQDLLIAVANHTKGTPAAPRGVVERQDALDAVIHLAARIDELEHNRVIPPDSATYMAGLLMVIRDFIEPLPAKIDKDSTTDLTTTGLTEMVDAMRSSAAGVG